MNKKGLVDKVIGPLFLFLFVSSVFTFVLMLTQEGVGDPLINEFAKLTGVPIVLGVITADTLEQAIERAGTKSGNYGSQAAMHAIEMANLLKTIGSP